MSDPYNKQAKAECERILEELGPEAQTALDMLPLLLKNNRLDEYSDVRMYINRIEELVFAIKGVSSKLDEADS